jgi:transcriptional regulator
MYVPAAFEITDTDTLHGLIGAHPLGTWVTLAEGALLANPIPFLLDPDRGPHGTLVGHVARANPVWRTFSRDMASLVVFQGPQAYVSPNWYPSKQVHGKHVPTWNYAVVQARGVPRTLEAPDDVRRIVQRLTERHEGGRPAPWAVGDAPPEYIAQLLRAIVGIEIPIEQLTGKWKVSQNRAGEDRAGVAAGLRAEGHGEAEAMASLVERHGPR